MWQLAAQRSTRVNLNDALLNLVCHETQDTWLHFEKGNVIMTDSLIQMSEHNLLLCGGEVRDKSFSPS